MGKSLSEIFKEILEGKTWWLKMESPFSNQRFYFYVSKISVIPETGTDKPLFINLSVGSGAKTFKIILPYYQYMYSWKLVDSINESTDKVFSKDDKGNVVHYCRSLSYVSESSYHEVGECKYEYVGLKTLKAVPSEREYHLLNMFGVEYLDNVLPLAIHKTSAEKANLEGLKRLMASYSHQERENVSFRSLTNIVRMFCKNKDEGKKVVSGWAIKASMRIQGEDPERRRAFEVLGNIDSTNDQIGRAMINLINRMNINLDTCDNGGFIAEAICGLADHHDKQWPYFREIKLDENDDNLLHIFISGSSSRIKHSGIAAIQNILHTAYRPKTFYVTHMEGEDYAYAGGPFGMRKIDACDIMHTRPILFGAKNVRKDKLVKSDVWDINI